MVCTTRGAYSEALIKMEPNWNRLEQVKVKYRFKQFMVFVLNVMIVIEHTQRAIDMLRTSTGYSERLIIVNT